MDRRRLFNAALTFVLTTSVLSWLAYSFATPLIELQLPLFHAELKLLLPAFHIDYLDWKIEHNEAVVAVSATLSEFRVVLGKVFPPGLSVNASTLAAHIWVHPV